MSIQSNPDSSLVAATSANASPTKEIGLGAAISEWTTAEIENRLGLETEFTDPGGGERRESRPSPSVPGGRPDPRSP
jgi:hypothetical protein